MSLHIHVEKSARGCAYLRAHREKVTCVGTKAKPMHDTNRPNAPWKRTTNESKRFTCINRTQAPAAARVFLAHSLCIRFLTFYFPRSPSSQRREGVHATRILPFFAEIMSQKRPACNTNIFCLCCYFGWLQKYFNKILCCDVWELVCLNIFRSTLIIIIVYVKSFIFENFSFL